MLSRLDQLEPDRDEVTLAAVFETEAQTLGLALDSGESLLLAVLVRRSAGLLLTGDKRAIGAIEQLIKRTGELGIRGRLACLEQLICDLLISYSPDYLRARICREPDVDVTLSICFSCHSGALAGASAAEGLVSYVRALRRDAPTALISSDDLSAVVA
jgi:hypothetical protein